MLAQLTCCYADDELLGLGGRGRELTATMVGAVVRPCCRRLAIKSWLPNEESIVIDIILWDTRCKQVIKMTQKAHLVFGLEL